MQQAQERASDHRDLASGLVVEQPRRSELEVFAAGEQLASTGCDDVLHPVCVRTIGQCQDVAATRTREDIDRGPVLLAGPAPAMDHDAQPRAAMGPPAG